MQDTSAGTRRVRVFYSGSVQGVGFRYTALTVARHFHVTGWVRNLSDGRVELAAEGKEKDLEGFLLTLAQQMSGCIDRFQRQWEPASGEWASFEIVPTV